MEERRSRSDPKRFMSVWVVIGALALASLAAAWAVYDPERAKVEEAIGGYVGDLRAALAQSASRRILPKDLADLKQAALVFSSENSDFRLDALSFLGVKDAAELAATPKERFFEFLIERTYARHPEIRMALTEGVLAGTLVRRQGDDATVEVTLRVDTPAGRRTFVMNQALRRSDEVWFVRL